MSDNRKSRSETTEVEKVLALNDRAAVALTVLREHGIELYGYGHTAGQIEALAEVVKGWED